MQSVDSQGISKIYNSSTLGILSFFPSHGILGDMEHNAEVALFMKQGNGSMGRMVGLL